MSETATAGVHRSVPILGAMGIEVVESVPGRAEALLPLEPNVNHVGMAYAGSLFSVAEMLGGLLALSSFTLEGYAPLVKSMSITFLRPALTAVRARAEMSAEEIQRVLDEAQATGKSNYELAAQVLDENGVIVATTVGQYQLRDFAPRT
ncbi:MAG: YiiD C-terminal domain-containing protein [Marmoricola sp.]